MGKKAGQQLGSGIAAGVKQAESAVKKSTDAIVKLQDKQANAADKTRLAEEKLTEARKKGYTDSRLTSAKNNFAKAQRDEASAVRATESETRRLKTAQQDLVSARSRVTAEFSKPLSGKGFLSGISSEMGGVAGKFSGFGSGAGKGFVVGATAAILAGGLLAVGAKAGGLVVDGFKSVFDTGLAFSKTLNNFQGVTRATTEEMTRMQATARQLGSDTTLAGASSSDAALAMTELAKAGFSVEQAMAAARGTLELATAGQIDAAQAAEIQSNAMNAFSLDATNAAHVADLLANAAVSSSADIPDLGLALQQVGGIAHGFGENLDDTVAALAIFANAGVKGSDAGTLLKTTMQSITDQGNPAQGAIKSLNLELYKLTATGDKQFVGFRELFRQLDEAKKRMSSEEFQAETNILFGSDAMRSAMLGNAQSFDEMLASIERVGGASELAGAQMQGLPGAVEAFKNSVEGIQLSVFDALGPTATDSLNQLVAWMGAHQPEIIGFFTTMATVTLDTGAAVARFAQGSLEVLGFFADGSAGLIGSVIDVFGRGTRELGTLIAQIPGMESIGLKMVMAGAKAEITGTQLKGLGDEARSQADMMGLLAGALSSVSGKIAEAGQTAEEKAASVRLYKESFNQLKGAVELVPGTKDIILKDNSPEVMQKLHDLGFTVTHLPDGRLTVRLEYRDQNGALIDPSQLNAPIRAPAVPGDTYRGPGRAYGGPITGPGGPKSDIIPIWASHGEHMLPADEVGMMGGQSGVYQFRNMLRAGMFAGGGAMDFWKLAVPWGVDPHGGKDGGKSAGPFRSWWDMDWMPPEHPEKVGPGEGWWWNHGPTKVKGMPPGGAPWAPPIGKLRPPRPGDFYPGMLPDDEIKRWGFKDGGAIGPDVRAAGELVGTAYSQANRNDCSGMVARVIDRTLGMPETGLMSTKNAKEWLAARGFKPGIGGPGQISVGWYDHGPNPNDGHMSMTLSDGSNAEAGGGVGDIFQIGGGAAGASDPQFDQHMFLPTVWGEGPAGSGAASSPFAGGSAAAAVTGGAPSAAPATSSSGGGGGGGSSFSLPSSISDLAAFGLNDLGKGVGATKSGSDLSLFGNAAGAAVSGQVDSALGVLGVNGSPGWLKAISTLVGGISIGGGGSAAPNAATPTGTGTPPPDDPGNMHGSRAGQQPGPVYNITARDTEDAFVRAQRVEREKAAAKLSRF